MNGMPLLSSHNRYAPLSVDTIENDSSDESDCVKDVQDSPPLPPSPSKPPKCERIQRAHWEKCLPSKYIISSDSTTSLDIDVEIETTDTNIKRRTKALVDCSATGLFIDTEYVCANSITTRPLA